ncbi:MAG TPA: hypothetical protein PL196_01850, partial [Burkholderiaceae bacterium]|nr:hypothetical protein [Burkholderiaceae bacterium]
HHQLSAQWQLQHGTPARALAEAEQGVRMADAVPFPLQRLSCLLLALCARLVMGVPPGTLAGPLAEAMRAARRIGSQGYLMNALFLEAVLAHRQGAARRAGQALDEAQAIVRACGAQRIRKIPPALLAESGCTAADARHFAGWTASAATT